MPPPPGPVLFSSKIAVAGCPAILHSVVRKPRKISAGAVPIALGVLATVVVLCWMPWNIVHPLDPSLVITAVHAPFWRRPTAPWGRVEIDEASLVIKLLVIWAGVGLWLGLSSDRWS